MKSLQAFTNLAELLQGSISHSFLLQIHAQILLQGAHQDNLIATRLIGHYPSQSALCVFHQLRSPNIFPFNAIIRVLSEEGLSFQVFSLFRVLKRRSLSPNDFTFSFLLKACLRSGDDGLFVRQAHAHILKVGSNFDSFVCNGLLSVYAKGVGDLSSASKLFDEMPDKGMVCCWTSLIAGFAQSGKAEEALELFFRMVSQRLRPDSDTMVNVLSACASLKMEDRERWVKILSVNDGDSAHQSFNNDSINMVLSYLYGRLGSTEKSRESFDRITMMGKRNIIAWNTMINAYVQNGWTSEALSLFRLMMQDPFLEPNHVSMVSVLSACAEVGDIHLGTMVDEYMKLKGHKERVKTNSILATAVIDMYCKCGNLRRAKEVFNDMVVKDVVAINAMIMGLATNGEGAEALRLFQETQDLGFHPNHGTFLSVLCACCHSGMLEEGRQIFQDMNTRFSVLPQLEHYASYIDLLSRFGHIEEALEVVASMPFKPNGFVWSSLLGGCLRHSRLKFIQELSRRLVEEDVENSAGFVLWSNALALDFQWGKVSELRTIMKDKGVKKQSGSSWISINGVEGGILFKGNLRGKAANSYVKIANRMQDKFGDQYKLFLLINPEDDKPVAVVVPRKILQPETTAVPEWFAAGAFGLVTVFTLLLRNVPELQSNLLSTADNIYLLTNGLPGAFVTALVLGVHELGHYLVSKGNGVKLGVPYFVPSWQIGSFGAITRILNIVSKREHLLKVAVAGPLAGFGLGLLLFLLGLILPPSDGIGIIVDASIFHESFLVGGIAKLLLGDALKEGTPISINPLLIWAWAGLLINAINSIPAGELDGGRIFFAIWGRKASARLTAASIVLLGFSSLFNDVAFYWAVLIFFLQRGPIAPLSDEITEPDNKDIALGVIVLLLGLLVCLPYPFMFTSDIMPTL